MSDKHTPTGATYVVGEALGMLLASENLVHGGDEYTYNSLQKRT